MYKAVALFSGGLDSQLAVLLIREQGVKVYGVTFATPFFTPETALKAAEDLNIPLEVIDFTEEHLEMLKNPKYGYGKNLNPCIDCHALMMKRAGQYMNMIGAHFIITGEVLGERPKSQNYNALKIVEQESGYEGLVLRPLSARLLPETVPEKENWVDRSKLGSIQGRSRKPQMKLASYYGLNEYPSPAGGCLLTVESFSNRLKDLLSHEDKVSRQDLELLKLGRHFRLNSNVKIVVGRNKDENIKIEKLASSEDVLLKAAAVPGPTTLYIGEAEEDKVALAASITARYSDSEFQEVSVKALRLKTREEKEIVVSPLDDEKINRLRIK